MLLIDLELQWDWSIPYINIVLDNLKNTYLSSQSEAKGP